MLVYLHEDVSLDQLCYVLLQIYQFARSIDAFLLSDCANFISKDTICQLQSIRNVAMALLSHYCIEDINYINERIQNINDACEIANLGGCFSIDNGSISKHLGLFFLLRIRSSV